MLGVEHVADSLKEAKMYLD